jgi:hypothetical protein
MFLKQSFFDQKDFSPHPIKSFVKYVYNPLHSDFSTAHVYNIVKNKLTATNNIFAEID